MKNILTVFFDLDDTLIDHKGAERKALFSIKEKYFSSIADGEFEKIWVEKTQKNWRLFTEKKIGFEEQRNNRIRDVWNHFDNVITESTARAIFLEYLVFYEQHWTVFPDVVDTLKNLKEKCRLGIITNGNTQQQLKKLAYVNILDFFEKNLIIISEEVKISKPSIEIFKLAEERANTVGGNNLIIGDNYSTDIEPALSVGWNALLIDRNKTTKDFGIINSLSQIETSMLLG